ncbi:adenine specific DNA methyltransferase [Caudoviricetes sp.]|nr:adenine specific DNA methyltransferase [Caudoviricetes sp.]
MPVPESDIAISHIDIDKLQKAKYNPRTIDKEEFEGLKQSIIAFDFVDPLVINKDNTIIGGHQRYEAGKALGYKKLPCVVLDLNPHQEKKLNALLNSQAISGKYDEIKLGEILEELKLDNDYEALRLNKLEPLDLSNKNKDDDNNGPQDLSCPECGHVNTIEAFRGLKD